MNSKRFNEVFNEQHENRKNILCGKAEEYASDDDRLHNFKVAAAVQELTPLQALAGMMAKHTVSVYDMLWSGKDYPLELWKEKITDSQNYLDLALALIIEGKENADCHESEENVEIVDLWAKLAQKEKCAEEFFNRARELQARVNELESANKAPKTDEVIAKHKQKTCEHEWVVNYSASTDAVAVLKCKKCGKKTLRQSEAAK